jgi:hypothetical protein
MGAVGFPGFESSRPVTNKSSNKSVRCRANGLFRALSLLILTLRRSRLVARSLKGRLRKAVGYSVTPLAESKVWAR